MSNDIFIAKQIDVIDANICCIKKFLTQWLRSRAVMFVELGWTTKKIIEGLEVRISLVQINFLTFLEFSQVQVFIHAW